MSVLGENKDGHGQREGAMEASLRKVNLSEWED